MKRLLYAAALVAVIGLIGCGSKVDDKETSVVNSTAAQTQSTTKKEEAQSSTSAQKTAEEKNSGEKTTEEIVDISGINPYAVKEIQSALDEINVNVSADDKETSDNVIKQAVSLRALAAGNSLVEEQVARVVKNWKQNNKAADFSKKLALVYAEYEKLGTSSAETELSKIGLSLQGHEYCGNGKLDVVEWINKYMK
ncbi:MAG: hypothetical protein J6I48_04500 [Lachnospira sp.]|nr:hypothetical protein [Lachnospira sp.]